MINSYPAPFERWGMSLLKNLSDLGIGLPMKIATDDFRLYNRGMKLSSWRKPTWVSRFATS